MPLSRMLCHLTTCQICLCTNNSQLPLFSKKVGKKFRIVILSHLPVLSSLETVVSRAVDDYGPLTGHDMELSTELLQLSARCSYHFPHIGLILFVLRQRLDNIDVIT